jgi:hypothetical protein
MVLKNTVQHSTCHADERHCGERRDTYVAAGPLANHEAQRRGGNGRGSVMDPNSSVSRRTTRGLLLRKGVWHIDKVLYGKRICESTHTGDLVEAEALLAHRASEARRLHHYG